MSTKLADKVNQAYGLCDELDGLGYGIGYGYKERDSLKAEFVTFILYFSMADGEITDKDAEFLKDCLDVEQDKEMMTNLYNVMCRDNIVYQEKDYGAQVPATILSYVDKDNRIYASSGDDSKSVAGFVADVYNSIGNELLADASDEVKSKLSLFMNRIVDYIHENLAYDNPCDFDVK
ncbi:MAG: hypothetical protein K6F88_04925 [Ruminococcus sp.]|nr:hypothetical protein [Ruminococcus sp.]